MAEWRPHIAPLLTSLRLSPEREAEIVEELSDHLDQRVLELSANGIPAETARRQALDELTASDALSSRLAPLRQASTPAPITAGEPRRRFFPDFWRDLRYAARTLRRQPGFTAAALLTLALGIGATTAVFSVVQHVLLTPLPYEDPDRAVVIWSRWRGFDKTWVSDAEILDYRSRTSSFTEVGAWGTRQVNLTGGAEDPVRVGAGDITPNLLSVLGVSPLMGRGFTEAEATADTPTVVILSYELWQQRFGGEPIAGKTTLINGVAHDIVGVMPRGFRLPTDYVQDAQEPTRLWLPLQLDPRIRGSHSYHAVARLKPGVTVEQANAELGALTATLTREGLYPEAMQFTAIALSTTDEALARVRPALWLVFGAVGCLLLIASANVANLLLVRAEGRTREFALRSALGADRGRILRQLMSEGVWLAIAAAVLGVGLAYGALAVLGASGLSGVPRAADIAIDGRVLLFSLAVTVLTLVLFSLAPAIRAARVDLTDALKDGSQSATAGRRRQRLRHALVVAETAMAVVLLTGAVLLTRSLWQLQQVPLGFTPDHALTMRLALPASSYDTPERVVDFYQRLLSEVRALPGVEHAGLLRILPLATPIGDWGLQVEGYQPPPGVSAPGDWQIASEGVLDALGARLVAGRDLTAADTDGAQDVALINEAMARKYWDGRNPIGGRFRMGNSERSPMITVVGVVGNITHNGVTAEIKPKFYRPFGQFHRSSGNPARNLTLVIRTAGDPMLLAAPVRQRIRALDAQLPIAALSTLDDIVATSIATPRLTGSVLALFAGLALLLAGIGIFGVLSYVVSQRQQELGVRLAIGAGRGQILALVLRSGLMLTIVGIAVGLAMTAAVVPQLTPLLHDVSPYDPITFVAVPVVLLLIATAATFGPAWRASRVDPLVALRP